MSNSPQGFHDLALFNANAEIAVRPGYLSENGELGSLSFYIYDKSKPSRDGSSVTVLKTLPWLDEEVNFFAWHWRLNPSTDELILIFDPTETERLDFLLTEGMENKVLVEQLSGYLDVEQKRLAIDDSMRLIVREYESFQKLVFRKLLARMNEVRNDD